MKFTLLRSSVLCFVLAAVISVLIGATPAKAILITKTTTYNEGKIWSDFTYTWNIQPMDTVHQFFTVELKDIALIKGSSFIGPEGFSSLIIAGLGETGIFRVAVDGGGDLPTDPYTISFKSTFNPKSPEGKQKAFLSRIVPIPDDTVAIPATIVDVRATTFLDYFDPFSLTAILFPAGTFFANALVDLFQDGHNSAQIAFGTANSDGGALLALASPVTNSDILVGQNGTMIYHLQVVPIPAALPLFLTGLAGLGFAGYRRRKAKAA